MTVLHQFSPSGVDLAWGVHLEHGCVLTHHCATTTVAHRCTCGAELDLPRACPTCGARQRTGEALMAP